MPFFSFSCLVAQARISTIMLKRSGEIGYLQLVSDLRGKIFNFASLSLMLAVGLTYIPFIVLRHVPSIINLLSIFIIKKVVFCQMLFLYLKDNPVFFLFYSMKEIYHIY